MCTYIKYRNWYRLGIHKLREAFYFPFFPCFLFFGIGDCAALHLHLHLHCRCYCCYCCQDPTHAHARIRTPHVARF